MAYVELHACSAFSFLRGGSFPEQIAEVAAELAKLLEQAAAMSEAEYGERATRTREELATELEPIEFYANSYRRLAGHAAA